MFKLNNGHIRNEAFMMAISKIGNYPNFKDPRVGYNAAKILRKIRQEAQFAQEQFIKLINQHAKKDENGKIVPMKTKEGKDIPQTYTTFKEEEDPVKFKEWQDALKAFEEIEFKVECHQVKLDDLAGVGLTPFDLIEIDPILDTSIPTAKAPTPGKPAPAPAPETHPN